MEPESWTEFALPQKEIVYIAFRYAAMTLGFLFAFFGYYFKRTFSLTTGFVIGWVCVFNMLAMETEVTRQGFPELMAFTGAIVGGVMALLMPQVFLSVSTGIVLTDMLAVLLSGNRDTDQIRMLIAHPYYHDKVDNIPLISSEPQAFWPLIQIPTILLCMWVVLYQPRSAFNAGTAMTGAFISLTAIDQFSSKSFTALCFFDSPLSTAMGVENLLLVCDRMCVILTASWFFLSLMGTISQFLFQYRAEPRFSARKKQRSDLSTSYGSVISSEATEKKRKVQPKKDTDFDFADSDLYNYFSEEDMPESMGIYFRTVNNACATYSIQFGFQQDNARNQAEHLCFLLSNYYTESKTAKDLHRKIFSNYRGWCDHLSVNPQFRFLIKGGQDEESVIEDLSLWFLMWGEASNLRHCPELLCFLFHSLSKEAVVVQAPIISRDSNAFLDYVVTPVYNNIKLLSNKAPEPVHYDDINEFFWFPDCLEYYYGSPGYAPTVTSQSSSVSHTALASLVPPASERCLPSVLKNIGKSYIEKRAWLHVLRSFHRVFNVLFVMLYLFICLAYVQEKGYLVSDVFANQLFSSVCIILAILSLWKEILEVWATFGMKYPSKFGFLIRLSLKTLALIALSYYYYCACESSKHVATYFDPKRNDVTFAWKVYFFVAGMYSIPWICRIVCAFKPSISTKARLSRGLINKFLRFWWPLSHTYIGQDVHSSSTTTYKYQIYWITMLLWKAFVSYFYQIAPLVYPTLKMYRDSNRPQILDLTAVFMLWAPFVVVFFFDLMIWNSLWQAVAGIQVGMAERIGEVADFKMFARLFTSAPGRFQAFLLGPETHSTGGDNSSKGGQGGQQTQSSRDLFRGPFHKDSESSNSAESSSSAPTKSTAVVEKGKEVAKPTDLEKKQAKGATRPYTHSKWRNFAIAWNEIIGDIRNDDMISNKEAHTLIFRFHDTSMKEFYLPLFVTADLVEGAIDRCTKLSKEYDLAPGDREKGLIEEQLLDYFNHHRLAKEACEEVYELFSWLLATILGEQHAKNLRVVMLALKERTMHGYLKGLKLDQLQGSLKDSVLSVSRGLRIASVHFKKVVEEYKKKGEKKGEKKVAKEVLSADRAETGESDDDTEQKSATKEDKGELRRAQDIRKTKRLLSQNRSLSSGTLFLLERMKNRRPTESGKPGTNPYVTLSVDLLRDQLRGLLEGLLKFVKGANEDIAPFINTMIRKPSGFFKDDQYAADQLLSFFSAGRALETIETLHSFLTVQTESEIKLKEARERLLFFANSMYMDLPKPPCVKNMKSWSTMTPFYSEDVLYSFADLEKVTEDGFSTFVYLQTLFPQEWANFLERNQLTSNSDHSVLKMNKSHEARLWATRRGQTLYRTVNGIMRYQKALELLAQLENPHETLGLHQVVMQKFQYVVSCQVYGKQRRELDPKAKDIAHLLAIYPHLRVAYVDSMKETTLEVGSGAEKQVDVFYSVLVKSVPGTAPEEERVQEVFRIQLPGNPILGEGKPENQNHAIIFTRGEFLQAIDMNQDNTLADSLKMRNLLEEFDSKSGEQDVKKRPLTIAGFREKIFTGSMSSVANYMALQEMCFVTLGQRVLDKPLRMRFHYGHPDVFDKLFFAPRGGISKASKGIHLSEDIFAGFNSTLRGGRNCFREYLQVGKGRDVGLRQLYLFEAKLSQGNCMQSISRDVYRLAQTLDIFKVFTLFYAGVGFYISNVLTVWAVYLFLYSRVSIACLGLEKYTPFSDHTTASFWFGAAGFLLTAPLWAALGVDKGFLMATWETLSMLVSGGPIYFLFHMGTKAYYFETTMFYGKASYRATGRGFVTTHEKFGENYRSFALSHFYKASELLFLLILYCSLNHTRIPLFESTWAIWAIVFSWFLGPLWFNPMSFDWDKTQVDILDFIGWIERERGDDSRCWKTWWFNETSPLRKLDLEHKIISSLFAVRFAMLGALIVFYQKIRFIEFLEGFGLTFGVWFFYLVVGGEIIRSGRMERSSRAFLIITAFAFPLAIAVLSRSFFRLMLVVLVLACVHHTVCHWVLVFLPVGPHVIRYYHLCDAMIAALLLGLTSILSALVVPGMIQTRLMFYGAFNRGILIDKLLQTKPPDQGAELGRRRNRSARKLEHPSAASSESTSEGPKPKARRPKSRGSRESPSNSPSKGLQASNEAMLGLAVDDDDEEEFNGEVENGDSSLNRRKKKLRQPED
eukprot:gb/GEZN01000120.1/.p1 GENE.gb/GEZN01000120.1/~~gb/GEZN01000120.1/.p1  ORF type:complete len:2191 (+),score=319.80 gb/GEZN01000120.1/:64-6636(+)